MTGTLPGKIVSKLKLREIECFDNGVTWMRPLYLVNASTECDTFSQCHILCAGNTKANANGPPHADMQMPHLPTSFTPSDKPSVTGLPLC